MATFTEGEKYVGKTGTLMAEGCLQVPVRIYDYKEAYGQKRVLVMPVGGAGEMWVGIARVTVNKEV